MSLRGPHSAATGALPQATLAELNAELGAVLDSDRVAAHREREQGTLGVPEYLARLRHARQVEARIEPQRRALGATSSLAYERSVLDRAVQPPPAPDRRPVQLALELSA